MIPSGIQGMGEILLGISSLKGYLFILKDHRSMLLIGITDFEKFQFYLRIESNTQKYSKRNTFLSLLFPSEKNKINNC